MRMTPSVEMIYLKGTMINVSFQLNWAPLTGRIYLICFENNSFKLLSIVIF